MWAVAAGAGLLLAAVSLGSTIWTVLPRRRGTPVAVAVGIKSVEMATVAVLLAVTSAAIGGGL